MQSSPILEAKRFGTGDKIARGLVDAFTVNFSAPQFSSDTVFAQGLILYSVPGDSWARRGWANGSHLSMDFLAEYVLLKVCGVGHLFSPVVKKIPFNL